MPIFPSAIDSPRPEMKSAALLTFAAITVCIVSYEFFDLPAARYCATIGPGIKEIFELITRLGLSVPYLVIAFAAFIYFKFIKKNNIGANAAAFLLIAIALAGIANDLIKVMVGRSRPLLLLTQNIYGFKHFTFEYLYASFPSGHSNTIAALCYGLYFFAGRFRYVLPPLTLAVMASRVIVGAHFPSDVIFGAYLGVMVTELVRISFKIKGLQLTPKPVLDAPPPLEKTNDLR